jgi:hypothetical protein
MAIAAEALSPEAAAAVSAAAAGHGSHLTPEVTHELRKTAARKATKAATPKPSVGASSPASAVQPVARAAAAVPRAASAINDQGAAAISGGHGGTAARIIFAFGAGLLALELASYLSGRYFTYNVAAGVTKLQAASTHVGLYPGQTAKLAASTAADSSLIHAGLA